LQNIRRLDIKELQRTQLRVRVAHDGVVKDWVLRCDAIGRLKMLIVGAQEGLIVSSTYSPVQIFNNVSFRSIPQDLLGHIHEAYVAILVSGRVRTPLALVVTNGADQNGNKVFPALFSEVKEGDIVKAKVVKSGGHYPCGATIDGVRTRIPVGLTYYHGSIEGSIYSILSVPNVDSPLEAIGSHDIDKLKVSDVFGLDGVLTVLPGIELLEDCDHGRVGGTDHFAGLLSGNHRENSQPIPDVGMSGVVVELRERNPYGANVGVLVESGGVLR